VEGRGTVLFQQVDSNVPQEQNNRLLTVYFEIHSSLYIHDNEASAHPSTEAT